MQAISPTVHKVRVNAQNTRRNFPGEVARKQGESQFLREFEQVYFSRNVRGLAAGEFALSKYGIADLVWIAWSDQKNGSDFSAISLEKQFNRRKLFAFEAKLQDWRRALRQAFRYRYFADKSIVIMPKEAATAALENLDVFRSLDVGFWTFDAREKKIKEVYTPKNVKALNSSARRKAVDLILSKVDFRKLREQ